MGDAAALAALPIEDADTIKRLPDVLGKPQANEKQQQNFINLLGLRAFSDLNFARALGLYATLANVSPGARAYTIQGLDAQGNPTGLKLVSPPVDVSQATVLPPSPDGVQAKVDETGVSLSWNPPAENRALPAISCVVERNGSSISVKPFVVGTQWNPKLALVVDRSAPPNTAVVYKIYTVDAFGRRSQPSSIRIFFPDFRALAPPAVVQAAGSPGKILVTWTAGEKPNLAGYVVERSFMANGPWETLMAQALPPGTGQYMRTITCAAGHPTTIACAPLAHVAISARRHSPPAPSRRIPAHRLPSPVLPLMRARPAYGLPGRPSVFLWQAILWSAAPLHPPDRARPCPQTGFA